MLPCYLLLTCFLHALVFVRTKFRDLRLISHKELFELPVLLFNRYNFQDCSNSFMYVTSYIFDH